MSLVSFATHFAGGMKVERDVNRRVARLGQSNSITQRFLALVERTPSRLHGESAEQSLHAQELKS